MKKELFEEVKSIVSELDGYYVTDEGVHIVEDNDYETVIKINEYEFEYCGVKYLISGGKNIIKYNRIRESYLNPEEWEEYSEFYVSVLKYDEKKENYVYMGDVY